MSKKGDRKSVFQDILGGIVRQDAEQGSEGEAGSQAGGGGVRTAPLAALRLPESQPRRYFDPRAMRELIESVRRYGILQPLLARPLGGDRAGEYELVAGERRYRAAREAGLAEVPLVVREMADEEAARYALLENLQREDLNPVEETEGILRLLAMALDKDGGEEEVVSLLHRMRNRTRGGATPRATHNVMGNPAEEEVVAAVFEGIGKMTWESFVQNRLPLLNLPPDVLGALRSGRIAYTKALAMTKVKDDAAREALLREAIEGDLSLAVIRGRVNALLPGRAAPARLPDIPARAASLARKLRRGGALGDENKRLRLEALLAEMESLVEG